MLLLFTVEFILLIPAMLLVIMSAIHSASYAEGNFIKKDYETHPSNEYREYKKAA